MAARQEARRRNAGPEDRDVDERCILGFNSGPPILPGAYNNFVRLLQTPGYVVILTEMVNDARLIPLDGRPSLPSQIRQWKGDSRGRWEGDTLVVETRNFMDLGTAHPAPNTALLEGLGEHFHLVERFERFDADTLLYRFTISDPTAFYEALERRDDDDEDRGHAVRVCVSRGQLQPAQHPRRRSGRRTRRPGREAGLEVSHGAMRRSAPARFAAVGDERRWHVGSGCSGCSLDAQCR